MNSNGLLDAGDTAATTYAWDHRNRLTHVTDYDLYGDPATRAIDYLYDTENRWIGRDVDLDDDGQIDTRTRFAYDGNQIVLQFDRALAPSDDPADPLTLENLSHRYLWNPAAVDQLMADEHVTTPDTPGTILWPLADHLGTIRDLAAYDSATDATTVVNHRTFDAYGNLQSQTSTNPAHDTLFAFTGRPLDQATGLQNNLHRWYDAAVGRWMSEDPIGFEGKDGNLNAYVGNGPVNAVDPTGLQFPWWGGDPTANADVYLALQDMKASLNEELRARHDARVLQAGGRTRTIDFKGSAWGLWELWWSVNDLRIVWDIKITGDTPFTLELRESDFMVAKRNEIIGHLKILDWFGDGGVQVPLSGLFARPFTLRNMDRAAYDIAYMWGGKHIREDNTADVYLGSYSGGWKVTSIDKENKRAVVEFTVTDSTNWASATNLKGLFGRDSIRPNESGAIFNLKITWTQEVYYGG